MTYGTTRTIESLVKYFERSIPDHCKGHTYHVYMTQLKQAPEIPQWLNDPMMFKNFHGFLKGAKIRETGSYLVFDPNDYAPSSRTRDPSKLYDEEQGRIRRADRRNKF